MGKRHGAIYYLFMEFRNNHHRYTLSDGSDELNYIRVSDLLQYSQFMPERVSETKEETFFIYMKKSSLVTEHRYFFKKN